MVSWLSARRFEALTLLALLLLALLMAGIQAEPLRWRPLGWSRWLAIAVLLPTYVGWCFWSYRRAMRADSMAAGVQAVPAAAVADADDPVLVVHASQTGFAAELAERSLEALLTAATPARLLPIQGLDAATLQAARRVLFVASTTGEGDAPDPALAFVRDVLGHPMPLAGLHYAVLALGDRDYADFCAFGHALERWLRAQGAQPLFDLVEVDDGDPGALRHWQSQLGVLTGRTDLPDWQAPAYGEWRLVERRLLNPGSQGEACYSLLLEPCDPSRMAWTAGDVCEIAPKNEPARVRALLDALGLEGSVPVMADGGEIGLAQHLAGCRLPESPAGMTLDGVLAQASALPHREYSIASLPEEGGLALLVRRMRRPDGGLGLGSGWLTTHAPLGAVISARVRRNAQFHPPDEGRPLIAIGNGTGIAGLRALLRARIAAGCRQNWLLFGERSRDRDFFFGQEIQGWLDHGWLQRLDLAFSRDQPERVYVQHRLRAAADELVRWVGQGAAVYVCGSLEGMAPAVHEVLVDVLGQDAVAAMTEQERYRRDVY